MPCPSTTSMACLSVHLLCTSLKSGITSRPLPHLLNPSVAIWWAQTCPFVCLPCQCRPPYHSTRMPFCMPVVSQYRHCIAAQAQLFRPALSQHHHLAAWPACSHTCHLPEPTRGSACGTVCKPAEFQHWVPGPGSIWQQAMLVCTSAVSQSTCYMHTCHVPILS